MPNLPNRNHCTGCTACVFSCPNKCINIEYDKFGFRYPSIIYNMCIECKTCEKVCPVLHVQRWNGETEPIAYAAKTQNELIRNQSTSGGLFSEFAIHTLKQGGIVYGATYDENNKVKHISITTNEQISKLTGAKYSESNLGNTFIEIKETLSNKTKVLFSGTPCQVAGLKSFLKKDFPNLICIDFICHGVPSPVIWNAYLKYIERKYLSNHKIDYINMRDKSSGWSNYAYSHLFVSGKKKKYISNKESLFMKLFIENSINRDSCSECVFKGYSRTSDITLGDFWGIWDVAPDFDDNKGTSAVLIHTQKGQQLFNSCLENINCISVKKEEISVQNPSLLEPSRENPNKMAVINAVQTKGFDVLLENNSLLTRIKRKIMKKGIYRKTGK